MKLGCEVDISGNGLLAVQRMQSKTQLNYDVILLDLEMPVMGKYLSNTRDSIP